MEWKELLAKIRGIKDPMKRRSVVGKLMLIYKERLAQLNELWNEREEEEG